MIDASNAEELRLAVLEGIKDLEQGRTEPWDPGDIKSEGRRSMKENGGIGVSMGTILLSAHARRDIQEIWHSVAIHRKTPADKLIWRFDHISKMLSEHLRSGEPRSDLSPNLFVYPVKNHRMVYRRVEGGIQVVRIAQQGDHIAKSAVK
jgi:plasmid stabilization system protein ParE